jgi:hypothetical protein
MEQKCSDYRRGRRRLMQIHGRRETCEDILEVPRCAVNVIAEADLGRNDTVSCCEISTESFVDGQRRTSKRVL